MENRNNISDALLAAYLDGNTNHTETLEVLNALKANPELQETLEIALDVDEAEWQSYNILPMMKLAAESGNNLCSVLCEAFILHRREIPFEEKELLSIAQNSHWLKPQGTPLHAIGQLLVHFDLMVTRRYDATIEDIKKALFTDNDILVVVDSDKLYPKRKDQENAPNHAVVVISIDTKHVKIFDPQQNKQLPIDINQFELAWKESNNYMIQILQSEEDYKPHPINVDQIPLDGDLEELQEAIAENAHDVWAEARINDGWTYGKERDDIKKKHPDLVPYSALPNSEKEYDRIMAFNTIKLVKKLGFDIVKHNK